jgi:hypothetical protein
MNINGENLKAVSYKMRNTNKKPRILPNTARNGIGEPEVDTLSSLWFSELPGGM